MYSIIKYEIHILEVLFPEYPSCSKPPNLRPKRSDPRCELGSRNGKIVMLVSTEEHPQCDVTTLNYHYWKIEFPLLIVIH